MTPIFIQQARRVPPSGVDKFIRRFTTMIALTVPALVLTGCQSMWTPPSPGNWISSLTGRGSGIDATALRDRDGDSSRNVDDVIGPLQRQAMKRTVSRDISPKDEKDHAALKLAQQQFDEGQYAIAARGFSKIAKKRDRSKFTIFGDSAKDRPTYDPIREEAVFFLAECQFQQNSLADATSNYQLLVKDYPSTRYMDESTHRLFEISKQWLGVEGFATTDEIRQVNAEVGAGDAPLSSQKADSRFSVLPNFTDRSRPVFDKGGHALKALKTIWLNDPSGPLADDSLMLAATYHLRSENYREADRLFTILREQFPKSPHLQNAFVLGSHVKLMSYQGAAYDEQLLADSKQLKEQALRLFPDFPERELVRTELKMIHEAEARREWELDEFYEKKRKTKAVYVSCKEIMEKFPNSSYAPRARAKLAELGVTVSGSPQSAPSTIPLRPLQEATPQAAQPFQRVPEIRDRMPDQQGDQVFPSRQPIFDDQPASQSNSGVGRTRL
jgi:outer membrane protein assembly factor BamD (BamD/ComL family)